MTREQTTQLTAHQFFPPTPLLSPFIASFWVHQSTPQARSRVLPTGTAQLILDLSGDGLCVPDSATYSGLSGPMGGRSRDAFPALLHGADTMAYPLETDRPLFQVGVDFRPGGAHPFFAPPAGALQNAHVSLEALWGRRQVAELRERVAAAHSVEECARLLEHSLLQQAVRPLCHHPAVALALGVLSDSSTSRGLSGFLGRDAAPQADQPTLISQVAEAAELSSGRLTRLFQEEVGLTPKQYARVRRFRTVLRRIHTEQTGRPEQRVNWARLAADCGYYDQSHLIKEFHTFAGVCPSAYLRARNTHSPTTLLLSE